MLMSVVYLFTRFFHVRSRCNIHVKNGKVYMKHNSLGDDVPIVVILRAMGAMSDQEIVQLVRLILSRCFRRVLGSTRYRSRSWYTAVQIMENLLFEHARCPFEVAKNTVCR